MDLVLTHRRPAGDTEAVTDLQPEVTLPACQPPAVTKTVGDLDQPGTLRTELGVTQLPLLTLYLTVDRHVQ